MSTHDEALVTELAELATDQDALYCGPGYGTCGWRSVDSDQAPGIITAILDRLVEKGWRPPATLNAWESYEQAAHDDGRCIGYGSCMTEPCTEMSPRIAEIRRSVGIQA